MPILIAEKLPHAGTKLPNLMVPFMEPKDHYHVHMSMSMVCILSQIHFPLFRRVASNSRVHQGGTEAEEVTGIFSKV